MSAVFRTKIHSPHPTPTVPLARPLQCLWHSTLLSQPKSIFLVLYVYCNADVINVHSVRFTNGLQSGGILDAIRSNPCQWRSVFVGVEQDVKLTARQMTELFKVNMSPEGSNRRRAETRVIAYWRDWLIEVEGEGLSCRLAKMCSVSHIKSGTNRKLVYDFLLVVYSNFCHITHRF